MNSITEHITPNDCRYLYNYKNLITKYKSIDFWDFDARYDRSMYYLWSMQALHRPKDNFYGQKTLKTV